MADNTIDTLSLEIESNSNGADKAIERLANSLLKLESSLGEIRVEKITSISDAIKALGNSSSNINGMENTASSIQKVAISMQRLSNINTENLENKIPNIAKSLKEFVQQLSGVGQVNENITPIYNIARAISSLSKIETTGLSEKMKNLASSLGDLQEETKGIDFSKLNASGIIELSKALSSLGGKNSLAAPKNMEKLAAALNRMMKTLSDTPAVSQNLIQMTQALANLASNGNRVSSASKGLINGLNGIGSSASKAKKHTVSLAAAFGKFYATYWLILRGLGAFRKAIDISSDLTEVQNVVDVTFGDMKEKVEDLASTSIKDFGMSELTAKQISSRFQAMGMAMGFAQDRMSDMSIQLTELAADMASFYNVEQSEVAESLSAIFTGQTRPLRRFGLDLTQATLQEWALKEGIDANVQSMSQMEKTMLRFQYVMANSKYVIGDYARTADTWHNSMVRLGQQFEQLAIIVGNVLINTFKPFIAGLNRMMEGVVAFAQTVANALGKIFGWTIEIGSGGIANDFEDAGIGAEEMADGTGAAKDNLKEMQKYIAAWHELNNMTTKDDTGKGGGGAGGGLGGGLGDAAGAQLVQTENLFDKYKSEIDSLYELGAYIGETLTRAMDSIDWDKVYERARNFGKGLADFLNGLISPELFGAVGRTIAGALNAAIYSALTFGQTFDWKNLGLSIASGINNFFQTFDFSSLAETINVWAKGLLDTAITAIDNTDWGMIGKRIGDFLAEIDFFEIAGKVMKALWKALNAAFATYEGLFERAPFETAILSLVGITKLLKVDKIKKFSTAIKACAGIFENFTTRLKAGEGIVKALSNTGFPKLAKAANVLGDSVYFVVEGFSNMKTLGIGKGKFLNGIDAAFDNIKNNLTGVQKGLIGVTAGFAEFSIVRDSIKDIVNGTGNLATNILELAGAAGIAGVALSTVFGFPAGLIAAGVIGLVSAFVGVKDAINEIDAQKAGEDIKNALATPGGIPIDELEDKFVGTMEGISDGFDKISEKSQKIDTVNSSIAETWSQIQKVELAMESGVMSVEEGTEKLAGLFATLANSAEEKFGALEDTLLAAFGENGALHEHMERLGVDTESVMKTVLQVNSDAVKRMEEITAELATMDPTNPRYIELRQELSNLMGTTDELAKAMGNYEFEIENIDVDYSGLLADDNTLNEEKLLNFLEVVTGAMEKADGDIQSGVNSVRQSLQEELQAALDLGDTVRADEIQQALDVLPQALESLQGDISTKGKEVANKLQMDFIGQIDDQIEAAQARWDEMDWGQRLMSGFSTQDEYVQNAINDFKNNYIDPLSQNIEQTYEALGIEGAGWGSAAAQEIIDSLFRTETYMGDLDVPEQSTILNETWREILDGSMEGLHEKVKEDGGYLVDGLGEGMKEGTGALKGAAQLVMDNTIQFLQEAGKIHSPSERTKPIGMYLLQGIVEGFSNSDSEWFQIIGKWADDTYNSLSQSITKLVSDAGKWFGEMPKKIAASFTTMLADARRWGSQFMQQGSSSAQGFKNLLIGGMSSVPSEMLHIGENIVLGLWNGISNLGSWLSRQIGGFCDSILGFFRRGFDEHSPSREAYEIGDLFTQGLANGMTERFGDIFDDVIHFADRISNVHIDVPALDMSVPKIDDYIPQYSQTDARNLQRTMRMEYDVQMAQQAYDLQQQNQLLAEQNQLLRAILEKPALQDQDIFRASQRGQSMFNARTGRTGWAGVD